MVSIKESKMLQFEKIKSIKSIGIKKYYDLEVPIYHNYVAQGIVHHNSGKDWTSSRLMCYALYWLLCLKNPQKYFALQDPKAPIEMVNVSFDEDQALYVYFKELKKEIAPFTPKQQGGRYSRREEWCDSSCLNFGHLVQKQKAA